MSSQQEDKSLYESFGKLLENRTTDNQEQIEKLWDIEYETERR